MNGMLGRLETATTTSRRLVSDASHELRTPVAVMRTELEVARRSTGADWDGDERRAARRARPAAGPRRRPAAARPRRRAGVRARRRSRSPTSSATSASRAAPGAGRASTVGDDVDPVVGDDGAVAPGRRPPRRQRRPPRRRRACASTVEAADGEVARARRRRRAGHPGRPARRRRAALRPPRRGPRPATAAAPASAWPSPPTSPPPTAAAWRSATPRSAAPGSRSCCPVPAREPDCPEIRPDRADLQDRTRGAGSGNCSRRTRFSTLPDGLRGISSTNTAPGRL